MELFWLFGEEKLFKDESNQKGRVFPNGTFMIYNSSDAFNTENATRITCVNNSENLESQSAVVYLGSKYMYCSVCRAVYCLMLSFLYPHSVLCMVADCFYL